ncbi:MAG: DMT family transporter [Actinobacteria bacterium]|nr:DMT family transporter [Actinomycetota bacterium]
MSGWLAMIAAVGSAMVLGASSVAQQKGTKRVQHRGILSPRIMLDLVRQPVWAAGVGGSVAGFALQIVALRYGRLSFVEPVLACDLIFAALISSWARRNLDPVAIAGVVACSGGVAGFLAVARPFGGERPDLGLHVLLYLTAALVVVLAGCLAAAWRMGRYQSLVLAAACGANYGTAAFLLKLVTFGFHGGLSQLVGSWPLYALAVTGPLGFLLNQQAFARAAGIAPVLAVSTTADPVVSIALAALWLGERLSGGTAQILGEAATLALMSAGIALLAWRIPAAASATTSTRSSPSLEARLMAAIGRPGSLGRNAGPAPGG